MNKKEILTAAAKECGLTRKETERAFEAILSVITVGLKQEGKISLKGFGTFIVKTSRSRIIFNPRRLEKMRMESRKKVCFKISSMLKL